MASPRDPQIGADRIAHHSPVLVTRDLTLRISLVPNGTSREALREILASVDSDGSFGLKDVLSNVVVFSIARQDKRFSCATITVATSEPEPELRERLQKAFEKSRIDFQCDSGKCEFTGITPLNDKDGDDVCDIIAVPGLASHPIGSWKSPGKRDIWLRDWLPDDIPNVRVLLYGYDTRLLDNKSTISIEQLGANLLEALAAFRRNTKTEKRPILFIGHSLGGLLVKEALVRAHKSPASRASHKLLFDTCCGILFFGVPHFGLRNEKLATIVQGQPNQTLIDSLVVSKETEPSPYLRRISEDFSRCFDISKRVVCFFERQVTPTVQIINGELHKTGEPLLMVTEQSATATGLTSASEEDSVALDVDHSGLVKFDSRVQGPYITVRQRVENILEGIQSVPTNLDLARQDREGRELMRTRGQGQHQGGSNFIGTFTVSGGSIGNQMNGTWSRGKVCGLEH